MTNIKTNRQYLCSASLTGCMCTYASVSNGPSEPGRKQAVPESARGARCLGGHDEVCKTGNTGTHTRIQGTQSVWACCAEGTCTERLCVPHWQAFFWCHLAYTPQWVQDVCMCELWSPKDAFRAHGNVPKGSQGVIDGNKVVDWLAAAQSLRRTNR